MRKILYLLLAIILFTNCKTEEFTILNLRESKHKFPKQIFEFPVLNGKKNITDNINRQLIQSLFDINVKSDYKKVFQNAWATKESSINNLSFLNYKINALNEQLYSVTFYTEGCGAYCEEYEQSYNFDIKSGNKIILDSLFTLTGKKKFLKNISNQKSKEINNYITWLEKEQKSKENQSIELYRTCLKSLPFKSLEYVDFKIKKDSIILASDRCSNHAMRALDNLGDYTFTFHKSDLNILLNDYGKNLLKTSN
ncbi:hypothetical protein [Polaribacter dokdonensis]|uniref:Uncharacterized protein n=1 Tax=Polaribacter dokdonensis DSW-5 TaxID=1300348 RepID=A0A0M9CE10_9FLAO|nr:hypothetical protein [Polaribacter dokdonensis]KOY50466.1 hypothetical protein I602_26 [Polaribacter dokdonensis DSW-5]SEE59171.1 hypothetical protein SAMN05444353_2581 [Polaribacter dokdonensis DSW-5]